MLLLDVWRRGMPLDMRLLSHLLIFIVRAMARFAASVERLADDHHPCIPFIAVSPVAVRHG